MGARDAPELREQVCVCAQSRPTPWTLTHQAPLSMGFSRQEFWSGVAISFSNHNYKPIRLQFRLGACQIQMQECKMANKKKRE